jgi:hypothetical protein
MARVNIIAYAEKPWDWDSLYENIISLKLEEIEIFPIPRELGFEQDGLGILVHKNFSGKETVLRELNSLLVLFKSHHITMTELYDAIILSEMNIEKTIGALLQ